MTDFLYDEFGEPEQIQGYVVAWNSTSEPVEDKNGNRFLEQIEPGAFDETVMNVAAGKQSVSVDVDHKSVLTAFTPFNSTIELWSDLHGLAFRIGNIKASSFARSVVNDVANQRLWGVSAEFVTLGERREKTDENGYEIKSVREAFLMRFALTNRPAYLDACCWLNSMGRSDLRWERHLRFHDAWIAGVDLWSRTPPTPESIQARRRHKVQQEIRKTAASIRATAEALGVDTSPKKSTEQQLADAHAAAARRRRIMGEPEPAAVQHSPRALAKVPTGDAVKVTKTGPRKYKREAVSTDRTDPRPITRTSLFNTLRPVDLDAAEKNLDRLLADFRRPRR